MQIACTLLLIISMVLAPVVPAGAFFPSFDELSAKTAQAKQLRSYQATWIIQGMASEKTSDPFPEQRPFPRECRNSGQFRRRIAS